MQGVSASLNWKPGAMNIYGQCGYNWLPQSEWYAKAGLFWLF
jgi:hypothetical protein